MSTILVIYTNEVILDKKIIAKQKKYAFNTSTDLFINALIKSPEYTTCMQVVKILEESYKYYNSSTGELSNKYNSTLQFDIRDLEIRDENVDVIYGTIIK